MPDERRRRAERPRGGSGWSPSGVTLSIILHLLAVALIFLAPHPMPASHPTAYTVEIVDPNALGGKLLEGPIGGAEAKAKPAPKPPPPPPEPEPPPPPPDEPPPPPEQVAKVDEPPPPLPEDHDDEAVPLGTPVATPTPKPAATARPTQLPTARPTQQPTAHETAKATAKPSPRASATAAPSAKPKPSSTPAIVVAKKGTPAPVAPTRRPESAATPAGEARPKSGAPAAPADDLDGKLAEAIKGVEAKVEKSGRGGGLSGATGPGGGQGGTEKTLNGPAGIGGEGPGGGGTVRGLEFVVYYNQMLNRIKDRWTWVGTRTDLRVTISFSILPSGEITNIRLTERSGDQTFDASVERAVKGAGPLPPPPEAYRNDFADVELKFRPADLQR
jgi:TolA protein